MVAGNARVLAKYVDGITTLSRKKNEAFLTFKAGTMDNTAKCRYGYLDNRIIKISEMKEEGLETYWEEIYPDYKLK